MKHLENFNVSEISNKDLQEVNAGGDLIDDVNYFLGSWAGYAYRTLSATANLHKRRYE